MRSQPEPAGRRSPWSEPIFSQRGTQPRLETAAAEPGRRAEAPSSAASLVERAAAGDAAAFGELYAAHLDAIYRHIRFRVRDADLAADLTQDVFLKAYRSLDGLRDPERFRAWLFKIAHHRVLNHLQRRKARPAGEALLADQPDTGLPPEALAGRQLDLEQVFRAAAGLTELQQEVVALRFVSGLSVAETAAIMDRKPNAIHNLQHNALAALRRRMQPPEPSR